MIREVLYIVIVVQILNYFLNLRNLFQSNWIDKLMLCPSLSPDTPVEKRQTVPQYPFFTETFVIQFGAFIFTITFSSKKLGIFFFRNKMRKSCLKNIWISKVVRGIKLSVESDRFDIRKFFDIEKRRNQETKMNKLYAREQKWTLKEVLYAEI